MSECEAHSSEYTVGGRRKETVCLEPLKAHAASLPASFRFCESGIGENMCDVDLVWDLKSELKLNSTM